MFLAIKNKNLIYCFLFCSLSFSQKVYVEDNNSGEPIENVAIYSLDKLKSTITNSKGEATIDDFTKSIPIIFQINGYDDLKITLNNYKVYPSIHYLFLLNNHLQLQHVHLYQLMN